jgi:nucleolar complex protein 2
VFLLAEWLTSGVVHGSVAFPEMSIQVTVSLRKALKSSSRGDPSMVKEAGLVRGLVDRIEDSAQWMEQKRSTVTFSPGNDSQVEDWERTMKGKIDESPMGKYFKVLQKMREKRRKLVDKVCVHESRQHNTQ